MLFSFMILCLHLYHLLGLALLHLLSEPPPLSSKKQFKCSLLYAPCSLYLCICTCMLLFPMLSSKWIANIYWVLTLCQACPWCFTCISSFNSMTYMLFLALLFQGELRRREIKWCAGKGRCSGSRHSESPHHTGGEEGVPEMNEWINSCLLNSFSFKEDLTPRRVLRI